MIKKENKNAVRQKRHLRVRAKVSGTAEMPRLNVYRSTSNIYVQIIDDEAGNTLVSSSTIAKGMNVEGMTKTEAAKAHEICSARSRRRRQGQSGLRYRKGNRSPRSYQKG